MNIIEEYGMDLSSCLKTLSTGEITKTSTDLNNSDASGIVLSTITLAKKAVVKSAILKIIQGDGSSTKNKIDLIVNDGANITSPVSTIISNKDSDAATIEVYELSSGSTIHETNTTNKYINLVYKDTANSNNAIQSLIYRLDLIYYEVE